jgi:serine/threonine protein kinase
LIERKSKIALPDPLQSARHFLQLMSLGPGTRLGPYEIQSALGAGGMGEVYRAADTNLGREVAIKVLPEAFAQDLRVTQAVDQTKGVHVMIAKSIFK